MMILQLAVVGRALTQNATGGEEEVIAAWFVGVLLGGALLVLAAFSAFMVIKRERWRRDVKKLISVSRKPPAKLDPS